MQTTRNHPPRLNLERLALILISVFMMPTALQASFAPKSFYDDFPLGRHWIALGGEPYSEHLVRDVGGLFLALIFATVWALWKRNDLTAFAGAWLVEGTLHIAYHLGHLEHFKGFDKIALVMSLGSVPILALVALLAGVARAKSHRAADDEANSRV